MSRLTDFPLPLSLPLIVCCRLDDFENSCAAYNKAVELSYNEDYLTLLNYAITLFANDEVERSREYFARFSVCMNSLEDTSDVDPEVFAQSNLLRNALTAV